MSWQIDLVLILRDLIGDICPQTYTDERLQQVILTSAQLIVSEFSFDNTYTIGLDDLTLSPDPTDSPKDDIFIGLVTLKAACILARGALRDAAAREGVRVKDKMGEIEIKGRFAASKGLETTYCAAYQRAKFEYALNNTDAMRAIFNVVIGPNIVTDWNGTYYDDGDPRDPEFFN